MITNEISESTKNVHAESIFEGLNKSLP